MVLTPELISSRKSLAVQRTTTDANGDFTFAGVAPGDYHARLRVAPPAGAEEDPEFLMPYFGRGATVRATAGAPPRRSPASSNRDQSSLVYISSRSDPERQRREFWRPLQVLS